LLYMKKKRTAMRQNKCKCSEKLKLKFIWKYIEEKMWQEKWLLQRQHLLIKGLRFKNIFS
jgi:hypothetical protein